MSVNFYDVIIIGGGAAGIACALRLSEKGIKTAVLEAKKQPLKKVIASGNGRCNATNKNASALKYFGDKKFLDTFFDKFPPQQCLSFLEQQGVLLKEEDNGRYFPITGKSSAVTNSLLFAAQENNTEIFTEKKVIKISKENNFVIETLEGEVFNAKKVVLACGSNAAPQLSGDDSGYTLAKQAGHTVTTLSPSLTMLNLKDNPLSKLQGIRTNAALAVCNQNQNIFSSSGEIMFTSYGLSGIPALNISRVLNANSGKNMEISINLFPEITANDLKKIIDARIKKFKERKLKDFFTGILHETIVEVFLEDLKIPKTFVAQYTKPDVWEKIISNLQNWRFKPGAAKDWKDAVCTAGGVSTQEINPNTFESNKTKGLYIIGELLDIDGQSGGYNLHFAFGCANICADAIISLEE